MKKRMIFIFLFMFSIFIFGIDKVFAGEFTIYYKGCNNLNGQKDTVAIDSKTPTRKCTDDDALGWYVKRDNEYICVNTGDYGDCKDQGRKIYGNGAIVGQTANDGEEISFEKVTRENADKFTVRFDANASNNNISGSMPDQEIVIDLDENLNKNKFERKDYVFNGWYVDSIVKSDNTKMYICGNNKYVEHSEDCSDYHGKRKTFGNGEKLNQTGYVGSTIYLKARWKVQKNVAKCFEFTNNRDGCESNGCSWNKEHKFCSNDGLTYLKCGDATDIPEMVPVISSFAVTLLKIVTPIVLIVMSVISLVKAITGGKEDDMKKAQGLLIKRGITAVIIFFVITIVQFIVLKVASSSEKDNLSSCLSCFLNGTGDSECGAIYYKDGYGTCYYVDGSQNGFKCD